MLNDVVEIVQVNRRLQERAGINAPCSDRYVTLTARWSETNSLEIAEGEVAELVSFPAVFNQNREVSVFRGNRLLATFSSSLNGGGGLVFPKNPLLVAGPARLALNGVGNASFPPLFCKFRVFPETYPPTGALVVPPGPGGGVIGLQCSADLANQCDYQTEMSFAAACLETPMASQTSLGVSTVCNNLVLPLTAGSNAMPGRKMMSQP